jgi:hypothetical protein
MIDITAITNLTFAFKTETAKDNISPERAGGILQQMANLLTDANCATRHAPHRLLPDIADKIRSCENEFTQWHSSHVEKLISPPMFENKKENKGYWF